MWQKLSSILEKYFHLSKIIISSASYMLNFWVWRNNEDKNMSFDIKSPPRSSKKNFLQMYNPIRTRTSWTRCRAPSRLPKTFHFPKSVNFHQIFCNVRNIWISCSPSPFSDVFSVIPCVLKCLVSSKNKTPYPNPQFSLFPPYLTHICWRSWRGLPRHNAKTTFSFMRISYFINMCYVPPPFSPES